MSGAKASDNNDESRQSLYKANLALLAPLKLFNTINIINSQYYVYCKLSLCP